MARAMTKRHFADALRFPAEWTAFTHKIFLSSSQVSRDFMVVVVYLPVLLSLGEAECVEVDSQNK